MVDNHSMKVAVFSPTVLPLDGYGNITYELVTKLITSDIEPVLFLPESQKQTVAELGLNVETRCVLPNYIFRIYQPRGLKFLRSYDASECDVVHSLFAFPYCIPAMLSARKYKKPFIMGAQGTHGVRPLTYFPEKLLLKSCYKHAKAITVPSAFTQSKIQEYAKQQYPIDIIHNGVHFDRFQKQVDTSAIKNAYPGKKILLTVGGLWGRKGHDLVLRALAQIKEKRSDVAYVIVGEGNTQESLQELSKELGVEDMVDFVGRKSGDDLVAYYKACDIYVHTPRVTGLKFEGFGIVYLEASACGKPIVAADAGGIRDAVLDGETGLIAPDGDVDAIADHILTVLGDEDLASRMGAAGREYAKKNDWNAIASQFVNLYSQVHE